MPQVLADSGREASRLIVSIFGDGRWACAQAVLAVRLVPQSRRWALKTVAVRRREKWCGRPDLNRHGPFSPTDFHPVAAIDNRLMQRSEFCRPSASVLIGVLAGQ